MRAPEPIGAATGTLRERRKLRDAREMTQGAETIITVPSGFSENPVLCALMKEPAPEGNGFAARN